MPNQALDRFAPGRFLYYPVSNHFFLLFLLLNFLNPFTRIQTCFLTILTVVCRKCGVHPRLFSKTDRVLKIKRKIKLANLLRVIFVMDLALSIPHIFKQRGRKVSFVPHGLVFGRDQRVLYGYSPGRACCIVMINELFALCIEKISLVSFLSFILSF
jgi:hypothetical protein